MCSFDGRTRNRLPASFERCLYLFYHMIVNDDSPLRRLPTLDPRETALVDAIRFAIEMADHAHTRLRNAAHAVSLSQLRKEQFPKNAFAPIFLDAWSIIDSVHRLRVLLQSSLLRNRSQVRGFLGATQSTKTLRDAIQHLDERLEDLAQGNLPTWGALAWMFGNHPTDHRAWCHVMVAGTVRVGQEHLFLKPEGEIRLPVDRLTLTAHGVEVSLSATMDSVEKLTRFLEDDIRSQTSNLQPVGSDLLLSLEIPWGESGGKNQRSLNKATLSVPEIATEAIVQYDIQPSGGKVLLYKTLDDQCPVALEGPGGELRVSLTEPRTLYYEMLTGVDKFRLWSAGWKMNR